MIENLWIIVSVCLILAALVSLIQWWVFERSGKLTRTDAETAEHTDEV